MIFPLTNREYYLTDSTKYPSGDIYPYKSRILPHSQFNITRIYHSGGIALHKPRTLPNSQYTIPLSKYWLLETVNITLLKEDYTPLVIVPLQTAKTTPLTEQYTPWVRLPLTNCEFYPTYCKIYPPGDISRNKLRIFPHLQYSIPFW